MEQTSLSPFALPGAGVTASSSALRLPEKLFSLAGLLHSACSSQFGLFPCLRKQSSTLLVLL